VETTDDRSVIEDKYPKWHQSYIKNHIEMYETVQQSDNPLYEEPELDDEKQQTEFLMNIHKAYDSIANYKVLWTLPLFEFIQSMISNVDDTYIYVQDFIIYKSIPLFFLRNLISSYLFKYISLRTCPTQTGIIYNGVKHKTNHQFSCGFMPGSTTTSSKLKNNF
jgi:hypothetical protein